MKSTLHYFVAAASIAILCLATSAQAGIVNITALDVRGNGAFGSTDFTLVSVGGNAPSGSATAADPLDYILTVANQDFDMDGALDDTVMFTLRGTGTNGATPRAFNQGTDTGFGSLNGIEFSVLNVSGTNSAGDTIVFDGFTGAAIGGGVGAGTDLDKNADVNGTNLTLSAPDNGAFRFRVAATDFALTPTVTFDNSGGPAGSVVARHFDLQFSTVPSVVPEPNSLALLGLAGFGFMTRRRRR